VAEFGEMIHLGLSVKALEPVPWSRSVSRHSAAPEPHSDSSHLHPSSPDSSSLLSSFLTTDSEEQQ